MTLALLRAALARYSPSAAPQWRFDLTPVGDAPAIPRQPAESRPPRPAAVLVLVYPGETAVDLRVVLTVRSPSLAEHAGQISLPGGAPQADDRDLLDTALRETEEELAVRRDDVEVLGHLAPVYVPPSNYLVTPFVALLEARPVMQPSRSEVDEILELPLEILTRSTGIEREEWNLRGARYIVPFYRFHHHRVWGATARVLSMLGDALGSDHG